MFWWILYQILITSLAHKGRCLMQLSAAWNNVNLHLFCCEINAIKFIIHFFVYMVNILILKFFSLFLAESPSSSASDIDNLNNQSTVAKAVSARGVYSPQIASNPISRNNHHLMGLLSYVSSWCHFQFYC